MHLRSTLSTWALMVISLKRLARDRRDRDTRREEVDRRTSEVLAEISHEMRQPLSAAAAAFQILRRAPREAKSNPAWLVLERQIQRLSRLVDDLSETSRSHLNVHRLRLEPLDLRHVVEEAAQAIQSPLAAKQHRLEMDLPTSPVWVEADWARLQQVLANLLLNGIKYTPPGGSLRVRLTEDSGRAILIVSDTGRGIRRDLLAKIFEPFATGDATGAGGLGVGLAIARRFVELHGGTIHASSPGTGRGSEFVVTLPAGENCPTAQGHPVRTGHPSPR